MVTITSIVALILVGIAVAISAFLGQVLQENLNAKVRETANVTASALLRMQGPPGASQNVSAYDVLTEGRQQEGVLLVLSPVDGPATGAVVASENEVDELTTAQVDDVADAVTHAGYASVTVEGLGEYRVYAYQMQNHVVVVGLPLSEVQDTITQIITAVLLVTAAGLLLLGIAIALVVRAGLAPLRAVADTATRVARAADVGGRRLDRRARARRRGR